MWVPSHIGIVGNEMVDRTADLATRTFFRPTITEIPINIIKTSINQKINIARQCYWSDKLNNFFF